MGKAISLRMNGNPVALDIHLLTSLGTVYCERGKNAEAIAYLEQALTMIIDQYGFYHPHTAVMYNNIAKVHQENHDWTRPLTTGKPHWRLARRLAAKIIA